MRAAMPHIEFFGSASCAAAAARKACGVVGARETVAEREHALIRRRAKLRKNVPLSNEVDDLVGPGLNVELEMPNSGQCAEQFPPSCPQH